MLNDFRTERIVWDKADASVHKRITANSGDTNGRKMEVQVLNCGVAEDLTGATLNLSWRTKDGVNHGLDAFDVIDATNGLFEIYYTTGMLTNESTLRTSLVLVDSVGRIESNPFVITVLASNVDDGAVQSENSFTALTDALVRVEGLEDGYAPQLQEVTAQLDQTTKSFNSVEFANSNEILKVKNYLGNYQNTHPKALYFENGWNGYKYWMSYTPYPNGDTSAENPCIAVSNDMLTWTVPAGLTNPLNPGDATNYNSDTHLVYRHDTNTMEIWWRQRRASDGYWLIYRRTTTDGVNWTEKELVLENSVTDDTMSPSIIFEDGKYKIWYVSHSSLGGGTGRKLGYMESNGDTTTSWSGRSIIPVEWESTNASIWHVDVIKSELGYELLFSARYPAGGSNTALFHAVQKADGTTTTPKLVISRNTNAKAIDSYGIYRSSFIKVNGVYHVFYAPVKQDANGNSTEFYLALSSGMDIAGLNGYETLDGSKKVLTLTDAGEVEISKEDAEYYDAIRIMGNAETTINIIRGGFLGKKLTIFLGGVSNALKCKINHRDPFLLMPLDKPYILSRESGTTSVDLVCYNLPERWRTVGTDIPPIVKNIYVTEENEVLTDFDITNYDTIEINGTGVVINSLVGGYIGKVIHIYAQNVAQSATLTYSGRLKLSGASDVTIGRDRMGVTAICRHNSNNEWIVF